jgi:hypothetical protein
LRALGYDVREQPFEFSAFPGSFATPLFGGAAAIIVGLAGRWGFEGVGARIAPLAVLAAGSFALFLAGRWLARRGVLTVPLLRARGLNLEATRSGVPTTIWLCAHLDTKSQPVPTLLRSAGLVFEAAGVLMMSVTALAAAVGGGATPHRIFWVYAAAVTLLGALPVVFSTVGTRSPGALDNASGVATVVAAARELRDHPSVGVLLTDAEELGLAGARSWSIGEGKRGGIVLNCDGVDDAGAIVVMFTGARPDRLLAAVARASRSTGIVHEATRLFPGVLTDSVAFTDAGIPSVTFSRGTWRSLARVHSREDDLDHLSGTGIAETATLIAATAREFGDGETR